MIEKIDGDQLVLSRFDRLDVEKIFDAIKYSYADICPWVSWLNPNYSLDDTKKFIDLQINNWENNEEYCFTIKNQKQHILGVISLHIFDSVNDVASIGYWMNSRFTKKGICTKALKLLVSSSFKYLNLSRIEVIVACSNLASQKVAENAGAEFESIQRNRVKPNGIPQDAKMYVFIPQ